MARSRIAATSATTSCTSPAANASCASSSRAVNTISFTRAGPTSALSRARLAIERQFPSVFAIGNPNRDPSAATRRSHTAAIPAPPPVQAPAIPAITGLPQVSKTPSTPSIFRSYAKASSGAEKVRNCPISVPAAKAFSPAPVTTRAFTAGSASARRTESTRP